MSDSPPSGRGDGLPNRTRAHRGGGRSPRVGPPGRETSAATSNYRRGWVGIGNRGGEEKSTVGLVLADIGRLTGEVGFLTIPAMVYLAVTAPPVAAFDAWLAASVATLAVGTLIRGGWIAPPWTDAPGWVRLSPTLLLLRLCYFNGSLLAAIVTGPIVVDVLGAGTAGPLLGLVVGGGATLAFPRVVDEWMARFG